VLHHLRQARNKHFIMGPNRLCGRRMVKRVLGLACASR
jgi:hypothetical protein